MFIAGFVGYAIGCGNVEDEHGIINFGYVIIECYIFVFQELLCFYFRRPVS